MFILGKKITVNNATNKLTNPNLLITFKKQIIMAKGQDAKKNVKKAPVKTAKEKKEEKRLKKSK